MLPLRRLSASLAKRRRLVRLLRRLRPLRKPPKYPSAAVATGSAFGERSVRLFRDQASRRNIRFRKTSDCRRTTDGILRVPMPLGRSRAFFTPRRVLTSDGLPKKKTSSDAHVKPYANREVSCTLIL